MYFKKNNNFFHGIMFHHFHDNKKHPRSQGSINKEEFNKIINFIGRKNILDADIFFEKFKSKKLKEREVCITFDHGMKCQIDIAVPVLEDHKIKSFFFPHTSIFEEKLDLEVFRYFRTNYFENINEFYKSFFEFVDRNLTSFFKNHTQEIDETKNRFPFYSYEDIKFRLVRDKILTANSYEKIMMLMISAKKINSQELSKKINFQKDDLININNLGHLIGLHTHSHPTLLEKLSYDEQKKEYEKNLSIIKNILDKPKSEIQYMSHPSGSYNDDTLKILKELGVELGFKQIMSIEPKKGMKKINNSSLEIAREDHATIIKKILNV